MTNLARAARGSKPHTRQSVDRTVKLTIPEAKILRS
jgi:hypothetical protein